MIFQNFYIISSLTVICLTGLAANLLVIVVSLRKNLIKGEYRWFILALACADFILCLITFPQFYYILFTDHKQNIVSCRIFGILYHCTCACTVILVPLVSLNRYVALYHRNTYAKYFISRKYSFLMVFVLIVVAVISQAAPGVGGYSGRWHGTGACGVEWFTYKPAIVYSFLGTIPTACFLYSLNAFCNVKIYQKLKGHQEGAASRLHGSNLRNYQELLKVAVIQAIFPFFCQGPLFSVSVVGMFVDSLHENSWLYATTYILFVLNSLLNPITVLCVVKNYKKSALYLLKNMKKLKCVLPSNEAELFPPVAQRAMRIRRWQTTTQNRVYPTNTINNRRDPVIV